MSIKAAFPAGVTAVTVNGLHQWDYGQRLEIEAPNLPALVEVHFATEGMAEAIVRSCAVVNGATSAVIPDQCLEQNSPILAWVYVIDGTVGSTALTVTMPLERRTRPAVAPSVPTVVTNKYTEAVTAINETVEAAAAERDRHLGRMKQLADTFAAQMTAAPTLNEGKQLTDGTGFYYVVLYESGSPLYCTGLVFWREGTRSRLATISDYEVGDSYFGTYRLDVGVDPEGNLYAYQQSIDTSGGQTQKNVTNAWKFYTKKFIG